MKHFLSHTIALLIMCLFILCSTACSNTQHVKVTLPAGKTDPQLAMRLNEQALVLLQQDKPDDAIALLKDAITADPQAARSYNNLGKVYYQEEQFSDALSMFRKAVELTVNNPTPQPHNNLAMVYERAGKYALAIEHYTKAHEFAPEAIEYTANLARALHHRGDRDENFINLLDEITLKDSRPEWQQWARTQKAIILSKEAIEK
jgi:Tfp pilus assembly protein PilF